MPVTDKRTATQREIDTAREILKPTPVRLHHVPRWLAKRLRVYQRTWGGRKSPTSGHGLLDEARRKLAIPGHWLDHAGSTKIGGVEVFVSEPYGFTPDMARGLDQLSKDTGLEWWVESNSWWYPGHTVRIVICDPNSRPGQPTTH